ncbi:hypothetical protein DQ240_07330 [Blastococcus sp. TF02A-26]|nr:hypothetical protein DQ240_07330 [Blastococcus sp. TF02A-26]
MGYVLTSVLLLGSAGCTDDVTETAHLFYSSQAVDGGGMRYQSLAELAEIALGIAQQDGDIPDSVEVGLMPDTAVIEVVAHADDRSAAARAANAAADELVTRLNERADRLGGGQVVVVRRASG